MNGAAIIKNPITAKAEDVLSRFNSSQVVEMESLRIAGRLDLRSIIVAGSVRVSNCVFEGEVDAEDARFGRSVQFINCIFEKGLNLAHSRVDGPLDLSGCVLKPMDGFVEMPFRDLRVEGCIEARRLRAECGLNLSDLVCGSALRLRGATIAGDFLLDSACIEGELELSDCEERGPTPAAFTEISGTLECRSSHIESRVLLIGVSLGSANFEQSQVGGTMLLAPGRHTRHPVELGAHPSETYSLSLLGASIHGNVEIRGARLLGNLRASSTEIRCNLVIIGSQDPSTTQFIPASLGSDGKGTSLRLSNASIRGALMLSGLNLNGLVVLENTCVGLLEIDQTSIKSLHDLSKRRFHLNRKKHVLILNGLEFGELRLGDHSPTKAVEFLALAKFDEGVYANVENWLRRNAKDDTADEVFRMMRNEETVRRRVGPKRVLYTLFGFFYGYGTRNRWACILWLLSLLLSICMFWDGSGLERIKKVDQSIVSTAAGDAPSWSNKASVIFRIHLPMIPRLSDPTWMPSSKIWKMSLRYNTIAYVLVFLNIINVTMIIASLSGFLKRRGS